MALECDYKEKEERTKCVRENKSDDVLCAGNTTLKCRRETLEKSVSEVIKGKNIDIKCEECVQQKHGEQWDLIDTDARNIFGNFAPSVMNCVAGIKHYGERIEHIDDRNSKAT